MLGYRIKMLKLKGSKGGRRERKKWKKGNKSFVSKGKKDGCWESQRHLWLFRRSATACGIWTVRPWPKMSFLFFLITRTAAGRLKSQGGQGLTFGSKCFHRWDHHVLTGMTNLSIFEATCCHLLTNKYNSSYSWISKG